ncbi:hypothetical protein [Mangrovicella endophytica]|uniref:hypothetical protein n=1 Tax=Mangrovicella endophytica TaxID=2066697 RepID=UPI0013000F1E|nr:hypothetical protein [Mangrovicella endophytica]
MPRLEPDKARQGNKGTPVLMILIIGLALAVVAFIAVQFYGQTLPEESLGTPAATEAGEGSTGGTEAGVDTTGTPPADTGTGTGTAGTGSVVAPNQGTGSAPAGQ